MSSESHGHAPTLSDAPRRLGDLSPLFVKYGLGVGAVALLVSLLLGMFAGDGFERFFKSYLVAFMFVLTICLGGLFFTMLQHATRAGWSVVIRRIAEGFASNLSWIWILFIPILFGMLWGGMYDHWTNPALLDPASDKYDEVIVGKRGYLNEARWIVCAGLFFAIWASLARFFVNTSIAQDKAGDPNLTSRMQWYAPVGLLLFALTLSFASFDWIMTLEPHWFSTIFAVYVFAGMCCGFFSLQILTAYFLQQKGKIGNEISHEHYQDMGKQLFAFGIVFWAYIAYSQYMLIWYANIPETTGWYQIRGMHGWMWLSLFLLIGHFFAPFLVLMSKHVKRAKAFIAVGAVWMMAMHYFDLYWLVMPTIPHDAIYTAESQEALAAAVTNADLGFGWHLLDLTCLVALAGFVIAGTARKLNTCSLVPEQDPRLPESLAFENM